MTTRFGIDNSFIEEDPPQLADCSVFQAETEPRPAGVAGGVLWHFPAASALDQGNVDLVDLAGWDGGGG
ncbi:MAG TPA: hypothetical protein VD886_05725, partial [Herpetosiphonaceae bacterium]|nr:hypothetical protein [Herpetosiphonaceae bacterium]